MITSDFKAKVDRLEFIDTFMDAHLHDGRMLRIPLDWYPRLERATLKQRKHYELIYDGEAMHWPDIDEDISIEGLLKGNKAPRTQAYLTGKFSPEIERERRRIERLDKLKKSIPSKRLKSATSKVAE